MIEVFKTDVASQEQADLLLKQIRNAFEDLIVNFDLEDCDNILRVESKSGFVHALTVKEFLLKLGCNAEVLPDEVNLLEG